MLIKCEPVFDAIDDLKTKNTKVIMLSPDGVKYNQEKAYELSKEKNIILLCGHYEGFDERINTVVDEKISIGDYVLTGGEIPAMAIIDSVTRLLPGVINEESHLNDSFNNDLLDYPQYTKPKEYRGMKVPDVLLSGDHKKIDEWRREEQIKKTKKQRPDLLKESEEEKTSDEELTKTEEEKENTETKRKQIGKYTYRELLKSDLQGLTDLLSKQPDGFDQYFKPHKFDIDSLRLMFENKSFKMLGVFDDSEIVGYFFIRFFANKKAFRGKMVDSNHQRQGIAKNIGRITTNIALDAGFRLFATISKNNFSSWYSSSAVNEIRIIKELPNNYLYIEYTKIKD